MKLLLLFLLFRGDSVDYVLSNTYDKLNRAKSIRYTHERDYFTGDKHFISKATNYVDFSSDDKLVGLRYQSETPGHHIIFNGTENFVLDKKENTIAINNKPSIHTLEGGSYFNNSLVTLRRNLVHLMINSEVTRTLKDTLYNNKPAYLVKFTLFKKLMDNFGGFMLITEDRYIYYDLVIDKSNFMPRALVQKNSVDEHSAVVTYSDIDLKAEPPKEESWYYSTYSKQYRIADKKADVVPLAAGLAAPPFRVQSFPDSSALSFDNYKGKILLLEFWIRNCGPCIESVPKLNALKDKFKGMEILAVNAHDRPETVQYFVDRYKVNYPVAFKGEMAAKAYGVEAFPVVFIINQKGNIVYSGGFDKDVLAAKIRELE